MDNPETVTTLGTRHRTKTTRTINTTQYVLGTTMQNTKDEEKQNNKHNTICVGHHYTQDTRRIQANTKHNTICVGHHYAKY